MHFLVTAVGSAGDVHPFIAIAQALVARGHAVRMIASPPFEARIRRAGIDFVPLGTAADYEEVLRRPELWDPRRGTRLVVDELLRRLPEAHAALAALPRPPGTILVGSTLAWGMRLLQEQTGLPAATVHLSPTCLLSATDPPDLPGVGDLSWMPVWSRRVLFRAAERLLLDRWIGAPLNRYRAELGLPPVRHVWSRWIHSPDLVIGAWPEWFAPRQADWPPRARTSGFPRFDERDVALPPALVAFLDGGPSPVGITPGSAMAHGDRFLHAALGACDALGRRAVVITPYREQLPARLPASVLHVDYAPFSALVPRLSGLVHHGGIGTSAQALAAGIPQLVVPFAHDQFDNATRLRRLGVAIALASDASGGAWTGAMRALADDAGLATAARRVAGRVRADEAPADAIATALERLGLRDATITSSTGLAASGLDR